MCIYAKDIPPGATTVLQGCLFNNDRTVSLLILRKLFAELRKIDPVFDDILGILCFFNASLPLFQIFKLGIMFADTITIGQTVVMHLLL